MSNLVQLMTQLGWTALKLSAKMEQLTAGFVVEPDDEARELTDRLVHEAIAFTTRLCVVCDLGTAATARELEKKLIDWFSEGGSAVPSAAFARSVEVLAAAAKAYAYMMVAIAEHVQSAGKTAEAADKGHEPARQLANAAVAFTMQLAVRCSGDSAAQRETTRQMEEILIARVNEAYATTRWS